jgi:hypothetical protein
MLLRDLTAYAISTIVIAISIAAAVALPLPDQFRALFTVPAITGLFSLLVQGWRDQVAHERARELQHRQQDFIMATTSHMANVVFDRQVSFCEQYAASLHDALLDLAANGPSKEAETYRLRLREIRNKHSPWVSEQLTQKLLPFEQALIKIATDSLIIATLPVGPTRSTFVDQMYSAFSSVLGIAPDSPKDAPEAAARILAHLREALAVPDFDFLRQAAITAARDRLRQTTK